MANKTQVGTILVYRAGPLMTKAGMSAVSGSTDLDDPIGWAVRILGGSISSPASPTDAEVSAISSSDTNELLDLAEYRLLENILGNLDDVDTTVGPRSEKLGQLGDRLEKRLARLAKKLESEYGYGASSLELGVVALEFAEHDDGTVYG